MVCATSVLKPGRARISRISNGITLPRTVEVVSLVAALIGGILLLSLTLIFSRSFNSILFGFLTGATLGWLSTTWSPLRGESLAKWLGLKFKGNSNRVYFKGVRTNAFIGIAPLTRVAKGSTMFRPGAVDVFPGTVDEEGRHIDDALSGNSDKESARKYFRLQSPTLKLPGTNKEAP